eukprot:Nitzschia sp. Nitz4//scaffold12_size214221//17281//19367//NITZ4_001477-RA/size214221-augustus-gene-0.20-mRNA-1//-1//CDS//3329534951//5535//frame0
MSPRNEIGLNQRWSMIFQILLCLFSTSVLGEDIPIGDVSNAPSTSVGSSPTAPSSRNPVAFPSTSPAFFNDTDDVWGNETVLPTVTPSISPTMLPTPSPTIQPTLTTLSSATARFRQVFLVENGRVFTDVETTLFQGLYASYTSSFVSPPSDVARSESRCTVISQKVNEPGEEERRLDSDCHVRRLQLNTSIEVVYSMNYESLYTNVTNWTLLFQSYVNANPVQVAAQMQLLGLNVSEANSAVRIILRPQPSVAPTITPSPSTQAPTVTGMPSSTPSKAPTVKPTDPPTLTPTLPPTPPPTPAPRKSSPNSTTIIVVSILVAGIIVLIGLLFYYRQRKMSRELEFQANAVGVSRKAFDDKKPGYEYNMSSAAQSHTSAYHKSMGLNSGAVDPSESLVSNQSLLSAGNSMGGESGDEMDATQNLADEFDQYKDQNLEKMRTDVEGTLSGFDGMMSQALTRALIDDDEANFDPTELYWGGAGQLRSAEVEANVLFEVTDWLKRKETRSEDERRLFMQDTLNRMVTSVRHELLKPDEASRAIHECAALLGLKLAAEIPVATLMISGMRKTVSADDMLSAFIEFGEITDAAVASNQRGFGILRFKSKKSVELAMDRYRNAEIVVQDVAVQVRVLRAGLGNTSANDDSAILA